MQTFENTVTIQRPAEEVFAFLADFENIPTWNYAIEETRKDFEVIVFQPASRLAIRGQIGSFQAKISYVLEATAGATRIVNNVELDPSPAVLRLLAPLATSRIKAAVAKNLDELRLVLEGGRPA